MTGGDVDGTCVSTSPQDRTEEARRLFLIMQGGCRTGLGARLLAHARQAALGNADGREIQPQTEVARQAKPARMSGPVPIEKEEVRLSAQGGPCGQNGWSLAERKQARNMQGSPLPKPPRSVRGPGSSAQRPRRRPNVGPSEAMRRGLCLAPASGHRVPRRRGQWHALVRPDA